MYFELSPKINGSAIPDLKLYFDGTQAEAHDRACRVVATLHKLFPRAKITVRIDRPAKPAEGYEIGADGHTV